MKRGYQDWDEYDKALESFYQGVATLIGIRVPSEYQIHLIADLGFDLGQIDRTDRVIALPARTTKLFRV